MKIKGSTRGITFSLKHNPIFKYGTRYRYFIDINKREVIILPDDQGKYKVSKKGKEQKPLFDLRNKEIKRLIEHSSYMEVKLEKKAIIVHVYEKIKELGCFSIGKNIVTSISDYIKVANKSTILLPYESLSMAVGSQISTKQDIEITNGKIQRELDQVIKVASLFSGAGLFDYPFSKDKAFKIKFAVDFDKSACETYRHNIGNHIIQEDIRNVTPDMIPEVDMFMGGICCQGYSNANRWTINTREGQEKRDLLLDYIRLVKQKYPKIFVIENVQQFLTKCNGKYLEKILVELSDYEITYQVVTDYKLGGYTNRRRMILIGSRIGKVNLPDIDVVSYKTVRDAFSKIDSSWIGFDDFVKSSKETIENIKKITPGGNYKDVPELAHLDRHSIYLRRLHYDEQAPTIPNFRKYCISHPEENRIISTAEASALTGLDGRFEFRGQKKDRHQMLANAVTQATAKFVKNVIKNVFKRYYDSFAYI